MPIDLSEIFTKNKLIIEEAEFFPGKDLNFWHSTVIDDQGHVLSAGFGSSKEYARKIAVSEFLERKEFRRIADSDSLVREKWGLNIIPTACGFAGGFTQRNVILRSVLEATERWVMSKWIDDHLFIEELKLDSIEPLDEVSKYIVAQFDEVRFFKRTVIVSLGSIPLKVEVAQTMGISGAGIFPGSSAQASIGPIWQHALIESFRHLLFVRNNPVRKNRFPDDKIYFFAENSKIALERIAEANVTSWPKPLVKLHVVEALMESQFFLARTIFDDWKSWNEGPLERFLF